MREGPEHNGRMLLEAYFFFATVFLEDARCVAKNGVATYNVSSVVDMGYCSQVVNALSGSEGHPADGLHSTAYFAVGHAMELFLKTYLLSKGWTEEDLRKRIGHDLAEAVAECEKLGLSFSLSSYIPEFSDYHKRHLFRYPQGPRLRMASIEDLIDLAEKLQALVGREGIAVIGGIERFGP